jgi:hypothetical protein
MTRGKTEQARARAAEALLDRAWGRPTQPLEHGQIEPLQIVLKRFDEHATKPK